MQKKASDRSSAQILLVSENSGPHFISFKASFAQVYLTDLVVSSLYAVFDTQNHPFLSLYDDLNIDLASYFTTAGSPLATFNTSNDKQLVFLIFCRPFCQMHVTPILLLFEWTSLSRES